MSDREDLLRIDGTGAMHPVGRAASQQLRPRAGEWRLIPSPHELIVARSVTGGDATMKLAGEIGTPGALCDIVALIAQSGWRGELVVLSGRGTRSLYFDRGTILGAATTVPGERIGEMLYRFGVVTRQELDAIVEAGKATGKRFGEAAIESGIVGAEKLFAMMARQVEVVFFAAVHVGDGAFYFFDRFDERKLAQRQSFNAGGLLMEAARRMDEMKFFREKIPNDTFIPVATPGRSAPEELSAVFACFDGKRDIAEIERVLGQTEFEVTRAVFQLVSSGVATIVAPRPRGPEAIIEAFNPAIAAIHHRCDRAGKGGELRDGLARFATGGGLYDPLFMGAGPLADGTLRPGRIAQNLAALASDDSDAWLVGLMNDYVGFALFQSESLLSREMHADLQAEVADILSPVRPLTERG